ncbi:TauD/TfdA family dioxygenase [Streptomyces roseifaciens]|uniref:TauD/TfdA family dioxygenase n=1 Tax=Streptomyces roseifaciens TaxID=1488406 RepID=UPI000D14D752
MAACPAASSPVHTSPPCLAAPGQRHRRCATRLWRRSCHSEIHSPYYVFECAQPAYAGGWLAGGWISPASPCFFLLQLLDHARLGLCLPGGQRSSKVRPRESDAAMPLPRTFVHAPARAAVPVDLVRVLRPGDVQRCAAGVRGGGIVRLEGLADRDTVARFAPRVMRMERQRDSGPDGLSSLAGLRGQRPHGVAPTGRGPAGLSTTGYDLENPPRLVVLACLRAPANGVSYRLVDGRRLYHELQRRSPAAAAVFSDDSAALFGGTGGVRGPLFAHHKDGNVALRLGLDAPVRWHEAAAARLADLRSALNTAAFEVRLRAGEGLLLDNHRWASQRMPCTRPFRLVQAVGAAQPGHSLPNGFRPAPLVVRGGL